MVMSLCMKTFAMRLRKLFQDKMKQRDLGSKQYRKSTLSRKDLRNDPFVQFDVWYREIESDNLNFPNAFTLCTADSNGVPSSRIVLLKDYDKDGFCFYSNSLSRKGKDMNSNPVASLCFWWPEFERQVRVDGRVSVLSDEVADQYFEGRPLQSRIGAWVSKQSQVLSSRAFLEQEYARFSTQRKNRVTQRPDFWKGYVVSPFRFEFWQGRENRLHDRFRYLLSLDGGWSIDRLYP